MPIPTFEQLCASVAELAKHMGQRVVSIEQDIQDNNALTDQAIEECNLKLAFLMQQITITKKLNGGLAGPDGRVKTETKTAMQVYMESGRAAMVEQLEAFKREQGLSATDGQATPGEGDDHDLLADHPEGSGSETTH